MHISVAISTITFRKIYSQKNSNQVLKQKTEKHKCYRYLLYKSNSKKDGKNCTVCS